MPDPNDDLTTALAKTGAARVDALGAIGCARVDAVIAYYESRVPTKRRFAKALRATALAMGMMASISPMLIGLFFAVHEPARASEAKDWLVLPAVLSLVAVGLVGFDRFLGASSGWMRFVSASLDLRARRTAFQLAWARERRRVEAAPEDEHLVACLDLLGGFLATIDDVVRSETQAWMNEFRGALAELDKGLAQAQQAQATAQVAAAERGALEVRVVDLAKLDDQRFELQLGDRAPLVRRGTATAAVTSLSPGIATLIVRGSVAGREVSTERAVPIDPGKVASVEVSVAGA